jgi:phospholipid/cholesterol/gamma-HCH transport system substrate-binding protein
METRAPYALIGFLVVLAIGAVFGFVYWMHNVGGLGERTLYRVRFENSVSGVLIGSGVMFNGIKVGEVTALKIIADNPNQVMATISVTPSTPVRADTKASLDIGSLTGIAIVSLTGGKGDAPPLKSADGQPPLLIADPLAWQSMTQAARTALQRVDTILADNADTLKETLNNLNTFSEALSRNSGKIDGIVTGLEKMTGGASATAPKFMFDLTAPRNFPPGEQRKIQLVVGDPTSVLMYESRKINVGNSDDTAFGNTQWSDNLPKLVQAKLIQTFDNSNYFAAVGRPSDDLTADFKLLIDIRNFSIAPGAKPAAEVEIAAKIAGDGGKVVATKVFTASVPVTDIAPQPAYEALNTAFGKVATELVAWAKGAM